jgi:hypothetical protein
MFSGLKQTHPDTINTCMSTKCWWLGCSRQRPRLRHGLYLWAIQFSSSSFVTVAGSVCVQLQQSRNDSTFYKGASITRRYYRSNIRDEIRVRRVCIYRRNQFAQTLSGRDKYVRVVQSQQDRSICCLARPEHETRAHLQYLRQTRSELHRSNTTYLANSLLNSTLVAAASPTTTSALATTVRAH